MRRLLIMLALLIPMGFDVGCTKKYYVDRHDHHHHRDGYRRDGHHHQRDHHVGHGDHDHYRRHR